MVYIRLIFNWLRDESLARQNNRNKYHQLASSPPRLINSYNVLIDILRVRIIRQAYFVDTI